MPRTKFEKVVFTLLTVTITVHLFVFYNLAIEMGGMSNQVFIESRKIIFIEFIFALGLQLFIAGPASLKIAFNIVHPQKDKMYIVSTVISCSTMILMCPMMTFVATVIHDGLSVEFVAQWMQKIVINFPFAFFTQLFFIQPLVRFIFSAIFRKNRESNLILE